MRYINRFTIDEDDQFEIIAVHTLIPEMNDSDEIIQEEIDRVVQDIRKNQSDEKVKSPLHIIWASNDGFHKYIDNALRIFIESYGYKSAMVTILQMSKFDCITKAGIYGPPSPGTDRSESA